MKLIDLLKLTLNGTYWLSAYSADGFCSNLLGDRDRILSIDTPYWIADMEIDRILLDSDDAGIPTLIVYLK